MTNSSKYRQDITAYEDPDDPLAPLTASQRNFILNVTVGSQTLPAGPGFSEQSQGQEGPKGGGHLGDGLDKCKSKFEFQEWFEIQERKLETEKDAEVQSYIDSVETTSKQVEGLLNDVTGVLESLHTLQENYFHVSYKSTCLHQSCQKLIEEQNSLEVLLDDVRGNLSHFLELEKVTAKLNSPNVIVTSDSFFAMLEQIDLCLSFMVHNPSFKESSVYAAKYKHCLNRALSAVKTCVNQIMQETTADIQSAVSAELSAETKESSVFPLIYGNFSAGIAKLKKLFSEIDKRRNGLAEYAELFNEIQQAFFRERSVLLKGSVAATVTELTARGKTGIDLCATVRMGCSFCINLCLDEFRLYGDFFHTSYTVVFDEFMEDLCMPVYDTLRPLIIKVQHLETLAELCTILRVEMLEEHSTNIPLGLVSFGRILEQLLQDTQERLVYRAHIYIDTDIRNYNGGPGDLAYPEKLEMMEKIAETLESEKPLVRSSSQTSLVSISSATSQEVAAINSGPPQIPRPLKSSSSPADLHGMWFPSVRRTLLCLSKLYRCLDKATFQGLSQEALAACIANVSLSARVIASKKTVVDSQLFEIKHLLILREQIAPFQVDFAVKETSLDFSRVKTAALSLLQKKTQMFSLTSNNALLEFIAEGTPQVKDNFLDSKKEVDKQLKTTCEQFIAHCTQILIGSLKIFLQKVWKVLEAQKEKPDLILAQQSFALPAVVSQLLQETMESLQSKLPFIHRSMKLYLANRETEFILFRPLKNNVLNVFLHLENITVVHYAGDPQVVCPTQEQINVLISSIVMQS